MQRAGALEALGWFPSRVAGSHAKAQGHNQCVHTWAGEGMLRPPSNPRLTAPLREQRADGERRPANS